MIVPTLCFLSSVTSLIRYQLFPSINSKKKSLEEVEKDKVEHEEEVGIIAKLDDTVMG